MLKQASKLKILSRQNLIIKNQDLKLFNHFLIDSEILEASRFFFMDNSEPLSRFFQDMKEIFECPLGVVDKCIMASELHPSEWKEQILWPDRNGVTIFGFQQVAMSRGNTISIVDALIWTGLCDSGGEIRKAMKNNGIKVNRKPIKDINLQLTSADALPNIDAIVLEFGKHNFGIIEMC